MSSLGQAVTDKLNGSLALARRAGSADDAAATDPEEAIGQPEVERVLAAHQISTSASTPAPAQLQARRLHFHGTKVLTGVTAAGEPAEQDAVERVPFTFDWDLTTGLNGVGSDRNLRGKSSVLLVLMWALRGRCDLQPEVRDWIDHVELDFAVDNDEYRVVFDVAHKDHHYPHGTLTRIRHGVAANVGSFARPEDFEEVMGIAMMQALRLPSIAAQTDGQRFQHVWPTYAGALLIRGDNLDNLLGEVHFAGLPSRLLSILVGAEWAASRAEATTAVKVAGAKLDDLEGAASRHAAAMGDAHARALADVSAAQAQVEQLSAAPLELQVVTNAVTRIADLDAQASRLLRSLRRARSDQAEAAAQLATEQSRRHQEIEDAVAIKFFQNLRPTMCPRCSAPVTGDRVEAESAGDMCSVCTTDLDMSAHHHHLVLSKTVPEDERARLQRDAKLLEAESESTGRSSPTGTDASAGGDENDIDEVVDDIVALTAATTAAQNRVDEIAVRLRDIEEELDRLAAVVDANSEAQASANQRQQALIDLARAEGAADALAPEDGLVGPDHATLDAVRRELRILEVAEAITTKWVQDGQRQRLADLGTSITVLARSFGMSNLTQVELGGGATMRVTKGGSTSPYTRTERGEKLRLKLATAIALIQQGRQVGVGRHPGLLLVDSPGAEEVSDDDFDTMLDALHREATASNSQVFIGTRHTDALVDLLGEDRCRLGRGDSYVW